MFDRIILAGNPNVGKSTLFNRLTGLKQHTGNWAGKTVGSAIGSMELNGRKISLVDTPGTYSLFPSSADEEAARETICEEECDGIIVVCDGCALERGLFLALQIARKRSEIILCVNLMDEAEKKGFHIDFQKLTELLGFPAVGISASSGYGLFCLFAAINKLSPDGSKKLDRNINSIELKIQAKEICGQVMKNEPKQHMTNVFDRLLTHKITAIPIMLGLLYLILWISIRGANYPSELLSGFFGALGKYLSQALTYLGLGQKLMSAIIDGIYNTTAWVVSVMLPPMAIFFPLFTLLEDWGLLPRIAFNMDNAFKKCGSCGKQALCMCMGIGCNAVGVTGCRIISDRRSRVIAMLTNSLMPCNGRFPSLMLMAALILPGLGGMAASGFILLFIILGASLSFLSSYLISRMMKENSEVPFSLELPPYRKPKIFETLVLSLKDRTFCVLMRAVKAAAPAGLIIWIMGNVSIGEVPVLQYLRNTLEPIGNFFGLDGAILLGFILGFPANEIVFPVIMMTYMSGSSLSTIPAHTELLTILDDIGWTLPRLLCIAVFILLHWPCATTLMTIKKESGKLSYMLAAAILPTFWGLMICLIIRLISGV